jgi:hypothetical protein
MEIAPYDHTKWIVLSSFFFTIPAIYAYLYHLYNYSILLVFTSLISANYWRNATYSWRRNMDLLFAKFAFIVLASNGVIYVKKGPYIITGYSGIILLLYCYYLSGELLEINNNHWYKFHMMFHFIMMYEQFIILDSIVESRKILQGGP